MRAPQSEGELHEIENECLGNGCFGHYPSCQEQYLLYQELELRTRWPIQSSLYNTSTKWSTLIIFKWHFQLLTSYITHLFGVLDSDWSVRAFWGQVCLYFNAVIDRSDSSIPERSVINTGIGVCVDEYLKGSIILVFCLKASDFIQPSSLSL